MFAFAINEDGADKLASAPPPFSKFLNSPLAMSTTRIGIRKDRETNGKIGANLPIKLSCKMWLVGVWHRPPCSTLWDVTAPSSTSNGTFAIHTTSQKFLWLSCTSVDAHQLRRRSLQYSWTSSLDWTISWITSYSRFRQSLNVLVGRWDQSTVWIPFKCALDALTYRYLLTFGFNGSACLSMLYAYTLSLLRSLFVFFGSTPNHAVVEFSLNGKERHSGTSCWSSATSNSCSYRP